MNKRKIGKNNDLRNGYLNTQKLNFLLVKYQRKIAKSSFVYSNNKKKSFE